MSIQLILLMVKFMVTVMVKVMVMIIVYAAIYAYCVQNHPPLVFESGFNLLLHKRCLENGED